MSYTLEPGDVDIYGKQYADIKAYNLAQEKFTTNTKNRFFACIECGFMSDSHICLNCEDIWGGDFADDEPPLRQAFDEHAPF